MKDTDEKHWPMLLSVVIVTYNVKLFLEQCLTSVQWAIWGIEAEVIVIDNNSEDGSEEYIRQRFPFVHYVFNAENRGFASANNQAFRMCTGKYILMLNPDTVLGENVLKDVVNFMEMHPEAGAAGVKMLDAHGQFLPESKRGFPTPWASFCKLFGLATLFPGLRLFAKYNLLYLSKNEVHEVDVLAGAFMFMRREALAKAGQLDESFFMYGEDIDLSYRLKKAGYVNYYLPYPILHYKGESSKQGTAAYIQNFYGAMLLFFNKYYPNSSSLIRRLIGMAIKIKTKQAERKLMHRKALPKRRKPRLFLLICLRSEIPLLKKICQNRFGDIERFDYAFNENVKEQIGEYTDIVFAFPSFDFNKLMEYMNVGVKGFTFHIYNSYSEQLISPSK